MVCEDSIVARESSLMVKQLSALAILRDSRLWFESTLFHKAYINLLFYLFVVYKEYNVGANPTAFSIYLGRYR